ncbi:hypothetical protein [Variovorax sp. Root411]|uniref:hypothetical protein n=1 Tax=Variovorax sp. Root411 TaxID=1736530 RepID=UPI0006F22BC7|nr:hypothetical protein [Variovorax sp. Root411]KQW54350.1 hypothetical protein ASC92_20165 [Variovorax sp. Root411]
MTASIPDSPGASAPGIDDRLLTFAYRGWLVSCGTRQIDGGLYEPVVFCNSENSGEKDIRLPPDTENVAYASEAEALRHGEQQAMRWIHDRTGRQGEF